VLPLALSCCLSALTAPVEPEAWLPDAWLEDPRAAAWPEEVDGDLAPARDDLRDREALRAEIARIAAAQRVPGVTVAIVDGAGTWTAAFGAASLETGRPMDAQSTLFRVGSLTKPFLSLAILRLVEAGRLRLRDRVRDIAPEIAVDNRWERTDPVRVEHLLDHTAGFDEMRFNEIFEREGQPDLPLRQVLAINPHSRVVRWRPGTRFAYSQPGYTLAGYIVEKVSGKPIERFLEEEVFGPLGVQGATLRFSPEARTRLATGYHRGRAVPMVRLLHRPSANLMISAAGLARLIEMQLGRGQVGGRRFLEAASMERMEGCGTRAAPLTCYGLGNWGDVSGPLPLRGHGGFIPGYMGLYRYSPARGFGYAVLVNDPSSAALSLVSRAILQHLLADYTPPPAPVAPEPLADFARYTGAYRLAAPDVEFLRFHTDVFNGIRVWEQDGRLLVGGRESKTRQLIATGPDGFRLPRDCETSIQFGRSAEGRRIFVMGNTVYEEERAWWASARRAAFELATVLLFGWPLVSVVVLVGVLLGRHPAHAGLLVRPLIAAAALAVMATAFQEARKAGMLGEANATTLTVWIASWTFGLAAHTGFHRTLRRMRDPAIPPALRAYALVLATAALWLALHLGRYGLIGLRTWRW
jgi:CubicO group peptidase (beta-lactamase class C family)